MMHGNLRSFFLGPFCKGCCILQTQKCWLSQCVKRCETNKATAYGMAITESALALGTIIWLLGADKVAIILKWVQPL